MCIRRRLDCEARTNTLLIDHKIPPCRRRIYASTYAGNTLAPESKLEERELFFLIFLFGLFSPSWENWASRCGGFCPRFFFLFAYLPVPRYKELKNLASGVGILILLFFFVIGRWFCLPVPVVGNRGKAHGGLLVLRFFLALGGV